MALPRLWRMNLIISCVDKENKLINNFCIILTENV